MGILNKNGILASSFGIFSTIIALNSEAARVHSDPGILVETHSLQELSTLDPSKNLAVKHPAMLMNAAQKVKSWIDYAGYDVIPDPDWGIGHIRFYHALSSGIDEAGGEMINGQYAAIESFVDYVEASALGEGTAAKMPLLQGPAGTGKSHFLKIIARLAETLTTKQPDYYTYTYEWINLEGVPKLLPILNIQKTADGKTYQHPFPCPLNESPLNLIPDEIANRVIQLGAPKAIQMTQVEPTPRRYTCTHCQFIRDSILEKHMVEKGVATLTAQEQVDILTPYVRVKRLIMGPKAGMVKIEAESRDIDWPGLTVATNPMVSMDFGPGHPASYHLSGKIIRGNNGMVLVDEFFRSSEPFRNLFLGLSEDKIMTKSGADPIPMDVLIMSASNFESIKDARKANTSEAQLDRMKPVPMGYMIHPYLEARNLLMMNNVRNVLMQKLEQADEAPIGFEGEAPNQTESEDHPVVKAKLNDLFPISLNGEAPVGPDNRYKLWIKRGAKSKPVHISPHTLMYMAMTVAGSRLSTDEKKALEVHPYKVIHDSLFRDRLTRLLFLMGLRPEVNAATRSELRILSMELHEGDEGISERDAGYNWLSGAIKLAEKKGTFCVTPAIAREVFLELLIKGEIKSPDIKQRLQWQNLASQIMEKHTIPSMQRDVDPILRGDFAAVYRMYDEVFAEISALQYNSSATEYLNRSGEKRAIDQKRLEAIKEIFRATEGRDFSYGEVTNRQFVSNGNRAPVRHQGLLRAVENYFSSISSQIFTYTKIKDPELLNKAAKKGYCPHCLMSAEKMIVQSRSKTMQVK